MANIPENNMMNWTSLQNSMTGTKKRAMRALMAEYTSLLREPAEGFVVKVDDPFSWDVGIYGPPSTPYWGGYFKVHVTFPDEYPFEPPKLKFKSRFWHPNVYHNGSVCMSILHDPQTEEIPTDLPREEKWNPTLSVRTVLLSLISIMGSPNPDSPANPEASKMYRSWLEEGDQDYVKVIEDIVRRSKKTAFRDGVNVPKTLEEYLKIPNLKVNEPLVEYSSDDDSDQSELLSLPSSQDSDQEQVLDVEPSWETLNGNLTSNELTNCADLVQSASESISSHQISSSICKEPSNPIAESLIAISSQSTKNNDGVHPSPQSKCSFLAGSSLTSRGATTQSDVSLTSNTSDSRTSPLGLVTLTDSSKDTNTVSSSTNDDKTSNNVSLDRRNGQIHEEASCLSREIEESGVREEDTLQERSSATASFNNSYLNPCREPEVVSSNPNSLSNPTSGSSARIPTNSRPANCNRKRRRPPRLYIYSQLNGIKKRKKQ